MKTRYPTYAAAEADGWRRVDRRTDRDVSGPGLYGYEYEAPDGQRSEVVYLSEERNKLGQPGAVASMFRTATRPI